MPTDLEFRLLGPLAVIRGGAAVPIPRGKQRALLAALLLRRGQVLSAADLVDVLWAADPPPSAQVSLQNHVMRLRTALGEAGKLLTTAPGGYVLTVAADQVDVHRFDALIRTARAAARAKSWQEASARAADALGLWRGTPLSDIEADTLHALEGPRLEELRLQALETRIDADLRLCRHGDVIGELQRLVPAEPLRERLHELLMLALYADGQQAEALAAYQRARQILRAELDTEPGPALRELHQQILTGGVVLPPPAQASTGPSAASQASELPVPRELPADVAAFTGRGAELAALDELLLSPLESKREITAAVISAVSGTAGVGKTALAIRWAHLSTAHFPDGQLHINLRGYDPAQPVTAAAALAGFLRSLGVPGEEIPAEETERAARYRSLLAGRRMLILLDNAATVDQVRPLLPGHAGCRVLVTSRDSLAGLVARDGATRVDLDLLPLDEAVTLLRDLIGEPAAADTAALAGLAEQCARLPLALRIAAELAAARPATPLADLVTELADEQRRLDLLDAAGDPRTAVRAVFSWSYERLDSDSARAFRRAGLHPGLDLESCALAALADSTLDQARRALDVLTRAHLIQPLASGRYGMHDLLRSYARDLADEQETRAAVTRLLDHYLATTGAAMDTLHPEQQEHRAGIDTASTPTPPISQPGAAKAWLDAESANLVAVAAHAASNGWPDHAIGMSAALSSYLEEACRYHEAILVHGHAREAAQKAGASAAEAAALIRLSTASWRIASYPEAAAYSRQALALQRQSHDILGQARALYGLALIETEYGAYAEASRLLHQALPLYREARYTVGEANALNQLGNIADELGHYDEAIELFRQVLPLYRQVRYAIGEAGALTNLGNQQERLGLYGQAAANHHRALAVFRKAGNQHGEAVALLNLSSTTFALGRYREAADLQQQAVGIYRGIGDPASEAEARNLLGRTLVADERHSEAEHEHITALRLASQTGQTRQQAQAHDGIAHCCRASGDVSAARDHWERALALYTELGAPEAEDVRAQLAALDHPGT